MFERTIWWGADGRSVEVIDQTKLPHEAAVAIWRTLDDAVEGIRSMEVRGAPLIGVAAAHGVALAISEDPNSIDEACEALAATRPTAVNLAWALRRCSERLAAVGPEGRGAAARGLATELAEADVAACRQIGEFGVDLLAAIHQRTGKPVEVLTHCNAGFLATVEWGTATAPMYVGHERGIPLHVWVSQTRPRNQGAALTAWEFGLRGVPHTLIVDNAAGHLLQRGTVDIVSTGADRVASNGDSANKIGTMGLGHVDILSGPLLGQARSVVTGAGSRPDEAPLVRTLAILPAEPRACSISAPRSTNRRDRRSVCRRSLGVHGGRSVPPRAAAEPRRPVAGRRPERTSPAPAL